MRKCHFKILDLTHAGTILVLFHKTREFVKNHTTIKFCSYSKKKRRENYTKSLQIFIVFSSPQEIEDKRYLLMIIKIEN